MKYAFHLQQLQFFVGISFHFSLFFVFGKQTIRNKQQYINKLYAILEIPTHRIFKIDEEKKETKDSHLSQIDIM